MRSRILIHAVVCTLLTSMAAGTSAAQAPTYSGYPAPGGTTFQRDPGTLLNAAGNDGGVVGRYSGFDNSAFDQLYFSFIDVANPKATTQSTAGSMEFDSYNSATGISVWKSTQPLMFVDRAGRGPQLVWTYLSLQFQPFDMAVHGALGSGWLTPTTAGDAGITELPAAQSVFADAAGDNFQIWTHYTVLSPTGQSLNSFYNSYNHQAGEELSTGTTGAFWYTSEVTATPEPASLVLLASGLLGVFGAARRSRRG